MIEALINSEKERITKALTSYEKLNHLNNYIQLKINCEKYKADVTIYGDIKDYLICYHKACEEKVYGYYDIDKKKVLDKINIVSLSEQINLLNFFQRIIKLDGQDKEYKWINSEIKKRNIQSYINNLSIRNVWKLIANISTYNISSLIITLLIIFIFYLIILLPAPIKEVVFFNSVFVKYSDNNFCNHLLNCLISFCNVESDFKINPLNWCGVLIYVLIKISLFVLIVGYLTEELKKRIF